MCGFLFEFSLSEPCNPLKFKELLDKSAKRGPDDQKIVREEHIQAGFNRLSILDLSEAGSQPMRSRNGNFLLLFNGEIYNHLELRKQLPDQRFRGHSDSETICACLESWGIDRTIKALDGMFALCIYDYKNQNTTLARDFAGIKPLFYGYHKGTLVAASQYDQVVCHPTFIHEPIQPDVLLLYLEQHFLPPPFALIEHTAQVSPGCYLTVSIDGKILETKYWEFPSHQNSVISKNEAMERLDQALEKAVKDELLSDVEIGAFLSGGVDSPIIAEIASRNIRNLKTFTIGSDSEIHDESDDAAFFAKFLQTDHSLRKMDSESSLNLLFQWQKMFHEPIGDFSIVPTHLVSALAAEKVKVALSGDGGDELFYGYNRFHSLLRNIQWQNYPPLVKKGLYGFNKYTGIPKMNSLVLFKEQAKAHQSLHSRFKKNDIHKVFPYLKEIKLPENYTTYAYPNTNDTDVLMQNMRKAEFEGMMQKTLRKVDLASMEASLEVRVPFLKKEFIEFSCQLPGSLSYENGQRKGLLKKLLSRKFNDFHPDERKRGFSIPLAEWIRSAAGHTMEELLTQQHFLQKLNIQAREIHRLFSEHRMGKDRKWAIFSLFALVSWLENTKR